MEKEFHTSQNEKNSDLPYGWSKGDTCVMITNYSGSVVKTKI